MPENTEIENKKRCGPIGCQSDKATIGEIYRLCILSGLLKNCLDSINTLCIKLNPMVIFEPFFINKYATLATCNGPLHLYKGALPATLKPVACNQGR